MDTNLLYRTRTYLIGPMQYTNGIPWRDSVTKDLDDMGVIVYNPYHKPFIKDVQEGDDVRTNLKNALKEGRYDYVQETMKEIRVFDLNLVDRSDFLIAYIQPTVPTFGSMEELVTGVRMKKPTFIAIEGGKQNCPLWLWGMFPQKYIYDSVDDIVSMLRNIDSGKQLMDSNRWRLLKKEYR